MKKTLKNTILTWVAVLTFLVLFSLLLRTSVYELFVNEPGVHYPRVVSSFNTDKAVTGIQFTLNIPTVGSFAVLVASILGIGIGIYTAAHIWKRKTLSKVKPCLILMAMLFFIQIATTMIMIYDFFRTAGNFG